jgi:hypothetical protein
MKTDHTIQEGSMRRRLLALNRNKRQMASELSIALEISISRQLHLIRDQENSSQANYTRRPVVRKEDSRKSNSKWPVAEAEFRL